MAKAEQVSAIVIVVFQCWRHVKESVPGRAAGATAARPCARQSVAGAGEGEWGCGGGWWWRWWCGGDSSRRCGQRS